jgi:hypothetical protein
MAGFELSSAQIRNRLVLSARHIVFDHWPDDSGRCPVCRTPESCEALTHALRYLECVRDVMLPTLIARLRA